MLAVAVETVLLFLRVCLLHNESMPSNLAGDTDLHSTDGEFVESFVSFCKVVIHCVFASDYVELQNQIIHPNLAWYAERGIQREEN